MRTSLARSRLADAATVRRAATGLAARARAERRGVLSLTQTAALGLLARQGPITPGEMARRLRLQPQGLTRTLASIEDAGWALRLPDPDDGRSSLLSITESGRGVLRAEMRPRDRWLAEAMDVVLSHAERDQFVAAAELLERLAEVDAIGTREP